MISDPTSWERLGRKVREARQKSGLSKAALAKAARVGERTVFDIEKGKVYTAGIPASLIRVAVALGWTSESVGNILDGGDPIASDQPEQATQPLRQPAPDGPDLAELMLRVHEFGRACMTLGGSLEARTDFEAAAQRLFESVPRDVRVRESQYHLAAYRPHALGEGVPADDAEAIFRAMEED